MLPLATPLTLVMVPSKVLFSTASRVISALSPSSIVRISSSSTFIVTFISSPTAMVNALTVLTSVFPLLEPPEELPEAPLDKPPEDPLFEEPPEAPPFEEVLDELLLEEELSEVLPLLLLEESLVVIFEDVLFAASVSVPEAVVADELSLLFEVVLPVAALLSLLPVPKVSPLFLPALSLLPDALLPSFVSVALLFASLFVSEFEALSAADASVTSILTASLAAVVLVSLYLTYHTPTASSVYSSLHSVHSVASSLSAYSISLVVPSIRPAPAFKSLSICMLSSLTPRSSTVLISVVGEASLVKLTAEILCIAESVPYVEATLCEAVYSSSLVATLCEVVLTPTAESADVLALSSKVPETLIVSTIPEILAVIPPFFLIAISVSSIETSSSLSLIA